MKYIVIFLVIFSFGWLGNVQADCIKNQSGEIVCGKGECAKDQYRKVFCAQAGGGALRDLSGNVQCGVGGCAQDSFGTVWCSSEPGGSAQPNDTITARARRCDGPWRGSPCPAPGSSSHEGEAHGERIRSHRHRLAARPRHPRAREASCVSGDSAVGLVSSRASPRPPF